MFKLLFKSFFIVIISMIIITGCSQPGTTTTVVKEQNNGTTQNPDDINTLVNEIKSMGFDTNDYSIIDGKIIVEGDIAFDIEELKKQISQETKLSSGPMKQYHNVNTVSPQFVSDIKIYAENLRWDWDAALNSAINAWNNSGTAIYFRRVSSGYQNITVRGGNYYFYEYAVLPPNYGDTVGNAIYVSYNLADGTDPYNPYINQDGKVHLLIHAMGHTLGLRHSNKSEDDRYRVPGTPSNDEYSVMAYNIYEKSWAKRPWAGFSINDVYTNYYLFNNTTPYAILYQDIWYQGSRYLVRGNLSSLSPGGKSFNDWASSIRLFNGARVVMWQHANFRGTSYSTFSDLPDFTTTSNLNDSISSIEFY
jgi:hypothetical protein